MKNIIVIKIGSGIITTKRNKLNKRRIDTIANQINSLVKNEIGIVLVVSGAVALGINFVNKENVQFKNAAAGIGQALITSTFNNIFSKKRLQITQILLTKEVFRSKTTKQRLKELLGFYIKEKFIPVINENDVLDLNSFKGNDYLAADITILLKASKLLILSTPKGSSFGVGGGKSKLEVLDLLKKRNIKTAIVNGRHKNIILKSI